MKGIHIFPKSFILKVNMIARLVFELAYYDVSVKHLCFSTTKIPHQIVFSNYQMNVICTLQCSYIEE